MNTTINNIVDSIEKGLYETEDGEKIFKYFKLQTLNWINRNLGEPANFNSIMAIQSALYNCRYNFNLLETKKVKDLLNNDNLVYICRMSGVMLKLKYQFYNNGEIQVTTHTLNQLMDLSEWVPLFDDDLQLRVMFGESIISVFEAWRKRLVVDIQSEYKLELKQLAKSMQLELFEIFLILINKTTNEYEIE